MTIFICKSCYRGFDIEVSGGISCPDCGGKSWKPVSKLPSWASQYRKLWAEKYGIVVMNEGETEADYEEYREAQ